MRALVDPALGIWRFRDHRPVTPAMFIAAYKSGMRRRTIFVRSHTDRSPVPLCLPPPSPCTDPSIVMTPFASAIRRTLTLFALTAALVFAGCDSSGSNTEDAPQPIEPAAFEVDTESYPTTQSADAAAKAGTHVLAGVTTVSALTFAVEANLALPKLVTAAALQADPVIESGTWVWESTAQTDSSNATFRLEGTPDGEDVVWEMFVSATGPTGGLQNFSLYTGRSSFDGTNGSWSLFYPIDGARSNVLDASFTVDSETTKSITFEVADGAERDAGDTIRYARDGDSRTVEYVQVEPVSETTVSWDAITKAGFIQSTDYNGNEKSCWSPEPELDNVPCS